NNLVTGVKNDLPGNKLKQNVVFDHVVLYYSGSFEQPTSSRLKNATGGEPEGYVDNDLGANRQHDGKHRPLSFASFLHEESSRRKVNFRTLETKKTDLADVLIPMLSVLEVQSGFENTLYGYFLGKKVAFLVVEMYTLNAWQKYEVKRVIGDKNGFVFVQFSYDTGLEGVLEHGPCLIRNVPFILRKWNPSSKLSKDGLLMFMCGSNFMVVAPRKKI
ncbi:zinc knuckle CX2CX4HX4C containing protein, partial [Tanacetum coccineum]